jgi:hypothetical protein
VLTVRNTDGQLFPAWRGELYALYLDPVIGCWWRLEDVTPWASVESPASQRIYHTRRRGWEARPCWVHSIGQILTPYHARLICDEPDDLELFTVIAEYLDKSGRQLERRPDTITRCARWLKYSGAELVRIPTVYDGIPMDQYGRDGMDPEITARRDAARPDPDCD